MKNIVFLISLIALTSFVNQVNAQNEVLYIVINEASWCPYCKANGERVRKAVEEFSASTKNVIVIHYDVSDESTKAKSESKFKSLGIDDYMKSHSEAAMVYVVNPKTKKAIEGFSIKKDTTYVQEILTKCVGKVKQK